MKISAQLSGACILLSLLGCAFDDLEFEKVQGPEITTDISFPLGTISYTVKDLVDDIDDDVLSIEEGNDFFLSFIYRDTTLYNDHDELISIADINNSSEFTPIPGGLTNNTGSEIVRNANTTFDYVIEAEDGEQLDSVFFQGGNLSFDIQSNFDPSITINYTFTLTDVLDGSDQPVIFSGNISGNEDDTQNRELNGLKAVSSFQSMENVFNVALAVTITIPDGASVSGSDDIDMALDMTSPDIRAVFGDFGDQPISIVGDEIETSALEDIGDGNIELANPSITISIENSYGIEMGVNFSGIKAIDGENEIALSGSVVDNVQFIDAPNDTQIGQEVLTQLIIDKDNSNLPDLLNALPNRIEFDLEAMANPAGSDNLNNFLYDDQQAEIITEVEIPFEFRMDGFEIDLDFETDLGEDSDAEEVTLSITSINEIPFSGTMDLSFKDDQGEDLYVIPNVSVIGSPDVGGDGRTSEALVTETDVVLDANAIEQFLASKSAVIVLTIETFSDDAVKIYSDYRLDVQLAFSGKFTTEIDL